MYLLRIERNILSGHSAPWWHWALEYGEEREMRAALAEYRRTWEYGTNPIRALELIQVNEIRNETFHAPTDALGEAVAEIMREKAEHVEREAETDHAECVEVTDLCVEPDFDGQDEDGVPPERVTEEESDDEVQRFYGSLPW